MLRACESGSKDLQVIRMPESGYTTDYLKAVIHTAKLYIRPLQTDLSVEPKGAEVSLQYSYISRTGCLMRAKQQRWQCLC